jgi:carboxyl-terminal processing protease
MKILRGIFQILSRYGWTAALIVLGAFAVGFTWSSSDELYSHIRLLDRAAITITSDYVDAIDESEVIKAGIDGMLTGLDPYSRYLSGADYLYLRQETEGQFEGIGVALGFHHDTLTIESVLEGTPSYGQGVTAGDRIVAIDGKSTIGADMRSIKMMLRGPVGSNVALKIARPGTGLLDFRVERDKVEIKAVSFYGMVKGDVGYIKLERFSDNCSGEVHQAISNLKKQGMRSLILDLRGNPGGLLIEAVEIASMLLPQHADIVETRGRGGLVGDSYVSSGKPDFQTGGLAILVDSLTASAAEIVAGAVQDHDRGVIIGGATFGKGLVQQVMQFSDDSALKLTTAKYYLPSGRCLQKPDWSGFELVAAENEDSPDSLFRTDSGRTVFGGGGVIPDIYMEDDVLSAYIAALDSQSCFFDFSLAFLAQHQITPDMKIDTTIMNDFRKFLHLTGFHFQSEERTAFVEMKKELKKPSEKMTSAMDIIDKELSVRESWGYESNYSQIASRLRETLVRMKFGETALYREIRLPSQVEILEALNILADSNRYAGILSIH